MVVTVIRVTSRRVGLKRYSTIPQARKHFVQLIQHKLDMTGYVLHDNLLVKLFDP